MSTDIFISWQFGMTFLAVLALGIWQLWRVKRRQRHDARDRAEGRPVPQPRQVRQTPGEARVARQAGSTTDRTI